MLLGDPFEMNRDLFGRKPFATSNVSKEKGRKKEKEKTYEFGGKSAVQWEILYSYH